jgi:peptidoglycan-N-acetylglucosamine deacetylase
MISISFSWDDGAIEDLKLMDLSLKYNIPGIFFIPAKNPERSVMSNDSIRILDKNGFEIGAHTYSHSYLTGLPFNEAKSELKTGKIFLEQTLGKEIPHFCFPGGKYNAKIVEASRLYYKSARTADTGAFVGSDSYLIKPTFHFYNRGMKSLIYNSLKNHSSILRYCFKNIFITGYFALISSLMEDLAKNSSDNRIIIWGHSWEIEKFNLWDHLEKLFANIQERYTENLLKYSDMISL